MNRGISYSGKRIRIKAVKYYVIAGQLIKLKVVNYSRLRPKYTKKVNSPKEIIKKRNYRKIRRKISIIKAIKNGKKVHKKRKRLTRI